MELVSTYVAKNSRNRSIVWYDDYLGVYYVDMYDCENDKHTIEYADLWCASRNARAFVEG